MEKACETDARLLCARDAELLALLESAAKRSEAKITQRRQRVRDCLVDHAEDISPQCVHALVGNIATSASVVPVNGGANSTTTERGESAARVTSSDVVPPSNERPAQPQAQVTTDESGVEVRIFLINHPAPVPAQGATPYIRIGGDSAQYTGSDHTGALTSADSMLGSPWLWIAVLPFICIGLYVSVVETVAFIRRRRDAVYRIGATQYMPIPSSSGSSKI